MCGKISFMKNNELFFGKVCAVCGKGVQHANAVSHAKNRVKITRKPNLHVHKMEVEGEKVKVMLCTKCKRAMRFNEHKVVKASAPAA